MRSTIRAAHEHGHWLLDLDVGGRVFRFSDEILEVETADGEVLLYAEGLDDVSVEYTLDGGSPQTAAVEIGGEAGIDWSLLVAQGVDLAAAEATLRRWFEGQLIEDARVILSGVISEPEHGAIEDGLELSIERYPWQDSTLIIPASAKVGPETWPSGTAAFPDGMHTDEDIIGAAYPLVIGCPGLGEEPATPALLVEYGGGAHTYFDSILLIAGHRVAAATVTVHDLSDGTSEDRTVYHMTDLLGRTVAYVADFGNIVEDAVRAIPGHEYWVSWPTTGGGLESLDRTGTMRRAGEVLRYLLTSTDLPVAVGRIEADRTILDRFLIDGCANESIAVTDWIDSELLPVLPIVYSESPEGVAYRALRLEATAADAVAHLAADADEVIGGLAVERVGSIKWTSKDEVRNHFTLDYAKNDTQYTKRIVLTGEPGDDSRESGSYLCRVSQARYGVRAEVTQTSLIWDDATAARILRHKALRYALPRRMVRYAGGSELEALSVGDVVLVSDPEVSLDEAVALIEGMEIEDDSVLLEVMLLDRRREAA
jgi:hypothetical protein